jgi:hypothetical protein
MEMHNRFTNWKCLIQSFAVFLAYYIRTNTFQTTDLGYAFIGGLSLSIGIDYSAPDLDDNR